MGGFTEYTRDGDMREQKSQEKDYNFLHDFIIKMFNKEL